MRVAFVTPATFEQVHGGGERYVRNLARGLVRSSRGDVAVEIVSPVLQEGIDELEPGVIARGIVADAGGSGYGEGLGWDLADVVADADVVHVHQVFTRLGEAAVLTARLLGTPVCVTDHGGGTSLVGRRLGLVDLADAAVAYSRFGAALLEASSEVTLIEGGVDAAYFTPCDGRRRDAFVFAGRIMAHKGLDVLIRACPRDCPLLVVGTPAERDYFEVVRRLAVGRDVRFMLNASDNALRAAYRRAIAVVQPSLHVDMYGRVHRVPELMGLTALEGMACGAPAVVMRAGGLPEYVTDDVTGYVVQTEAELSHQLRHLVDEPSAAERMGRAARERVEASWTCDIAGAALHELYSRLIAG